jgi:hypothetical protein
LLLAPRSKKDRKRRGKNAERVGQQHRKVQELMHKFVGEVIAKRGGNPTKALVRTETAKLNEGIKNFGKKMLEVRPPSAYDPPLKTPFWRLGSPPSKPKFML